MVRDELRAGDLEAIVAHHRRIYGEEYGVDSSFGDFVAKAVAHTAERGFPGDREAAIRWVVLSPEVRGNGLGRRLLGEMLTFAEDHGYRRVWLETFSDLEAAAHLYREHGFVVTSADTAPRWGRESVTFQRYELELEARARLSA